MKQCSSCHNQVDDLGHLCPHCGSEAGFYSGGSGAEALSMLDAMQKQTEAARLVDRGARLIMQGRYAEAEKQLTTALAVNPMNATAHGNMGGLLLRQGRPGEAIPLLEKALQLHPGLEGVGQALAQAKAQARSRSTDAATPASGQQAVPGIDGWLLLPAIALGAQPIGFLHKIYAVLGHANGFARILVIWPALWLDFVLLAMVAMVSWGFFRKRSFTVPLFIAYIALMWVCWAVISGVSGQHLDEGLIGMSVHLAVLVPYLLFSKRVAATFVCEPKNLLDRCLAGLGRYPAALSGFLQRQHWFVLIHIVVFFAAMVVLNVAIRSLYLNGNPWETWRLIVG